MSLRASYSNDNKVDQTSVCVRYSVVYVDSETPYYRVTRTASRSYSYIGMTESAAIQCSHDKIAQYTRPYYSLRTTDAALPTVVSKTAKMASVTPYQTNGDSWACSIRVEEEDVRYSATPPSDLTAIFSAENARNYDDPFQGYSIVLYATMSYYRVTSTLPDFEADRCVVQGKNDELSEWQTVPVEWVGDDVFEPSGEWAYLRVLYGNYESNVLHV